MPSRRAWLENCVSACSTGREMFSGTRLDQEPLQRRVHLLEHREGAEHRQADGRERHQRDQRREGQAARGQPEPVLAEALVQRLQRREPRPALQRLQRARQLARRRRRMGTLIAGIIASDEPPLASVAVLPSAVLRTRAAAVGNLLALIVLGPAWELWLAPTGSGWLALKALPLLLPPPGLWRMRLYTYRWTSLFVWLYFVEGAVRAASDRGLGATLGLVEALLCVTLFTACTLHACARGFGRTTSRGPT